MSSKTIKKNKKKLVSNTNDSFLICTRCNPKKFLKFNFSFVSEIGKASDQDAAKLLKRLIFLSSEEYQTMIFRYQGNKQAFIEKIPLNLIRNHIPNDFRKIYPPETNEKYDVFRVYPAGSPEGTANPRIIGMIKNTIFYIFYIDWNGKMYHH